MRKHKGLTVKSQNQECTNTRIGVVIPPKATNLIYNDVLSEFVLYFLCHTPTQI